MIFTALAFIPVYRFGKGISLHQSAKDAERISDNFLRQRKIDPAAYHRVVWVTGNVDYSALHYLTERKSIEQADQIYRQATRLALWETRYYQPLQKEEYLVFVDPMSGEVFGFRHSLEENSSGASPSSDQARTLAEQAVRGYGYSLENFELQSSDSKKRKARQDYTLVWQARAGDPRNVGDAHYRLTVDIAGDQVVSFSRLFKLPEEWERAQASRTLVNNILMGVSALAGLALFSGGLIIFVSLVRSGQMQWKRSAKFGVVIAVLGLLSTLNGLSQAYRNYDTSMPIVVWKSLLAIGVTVVPLLEGLLAWLVIGSAVSLYAEAWKAFSSAARRVWRRDALVALVLSLAIGAGMARVSPLLTSALHVYAPIQDELFSSTFSTLLPAAGFFLSILTRTILLAAVLGIAIFIARAAWKLRAWWFWVGLALLLVSLGPTRVHSLAEFGAGWVMSALPMVVGVVLVGFFLRGNILAYLVVLFGTQSADALVDLFGQPNKFYLQNGVALALLTAAVLAWMLWPFGGVDENKA